MPLARPINNLACIGRGSFVQKRIQHMDGIIQKVIVRFSDPDLEFAFELGAERLPMLLQQEAQIILLPLFGDLMIDDARLRIPQRDWAAISTAWPVDRIPRPPLATRHRPTITAAEGVLKLALVAHRVAHVAVNVTGTGPLETMFIDIC